ncbi:hypothetical protein ASG49_07190 [Marmoricola sp. Leaf446]|nr:hypothetical protein ASG49_07190 [Marmoricola sp. Leaf446]
MVVLWDVAVTATFFARPGWFSDGEFPFALFGSAIALFIGVSINAAYGRWWEARTLWGQVVNSSRSLGRQAVTTIGDQGAARAVVQAQIAYVHALRTSLRGQDLPHEASVHLPDAPDPDDPRVADTPTAILARCGDILARSRARDDVSELARVQLESTLVALTDAQGGLERIKNTPLPVQYRVLPSLFARLFCLVLPFAVVHDLMWATPVGSALISFMFLITVKVGTDLADPFTDGVHDVPMTTLCRTIEIDLLRLIREEAPPRLTPTDSVLW